MRLRDDVQYKTLIPSDPSMRVVLVVGNTKVLRPYVGRWSVIALSCRRNINRETPTEPFARTWCKRARRISPVDALLFLARSMLRSPVTNGFSRKEPHHSYAYVARGFHSLHTRVVNSVSSITELPYYQNGTSSSSPSSPV